MAEDTSEREGVETVADKNGAAPEGEPRGFVSDIIMNAVEPGVSYSVLLFLNIVFLLLLLTLVALMLLTGFNIHLMVFSILTVGLMIGFNIFISQLKPNEPETEQQVNKDDKRTKQD